MDKFAEVYEKLIMEGSNFKKIMTSDNVEIPNDKIYKIISIIGKLKQNENLPDNVKEQIEELRTAVGDLFKYLIP